MRLVIILIFITLSLQSYAQTGQRWLDYLDNDLVRMNRQLNFSTALISAGWLTGMYLLSSYDEDVNQSVKCIYKGGWQKYFDAIDYLGYAPYSIPAGVGLTGLTLLGNDKKLQDAAFTSVEAALVSGIVVSAFKLVIGRTRPDAGKGAYCYLPFSDWDASFPSGHSAIAFALVTPWMYYYPGPLTYTLMLFPASTAIARMLLDKHWLTDVLTGSVVGIFVGYTLAKWHKELAEKNRYYSPNNNPPMMISYAFRL